MITTADPKSKPQSPPGQHPGSDPTKPRHSEHEPQSEGIQPMAAPGPLINFTTHNSFTPGYAWIEFTNPAAITAGASIYGNLPAQGAAEYLTHLTQPLAAVVIPQTVPSLGSLTQAQTGMSPQGFPGLPTPIPNTSVLPATAGIGAVALNTSATPPQVTISVVGTGSIPANSRWLIFSLTGV